MKIIINPYHNTIKVAKFRFIGICSVYTHIYRHVHIIYINISNYSFEVYAFVDITRTASKTHIGFLNQQRRNKRWVSEWVSEPPFPFSRLLLQLKFEIKHTFIYTKY